MLPVSGSYLASRFERKKVCGKRDVKSTCFEEKVNCHPSERRWFPKYWGDSFTRYDLATPPSTCSREKVPPLDGILSAGQTDAVSSKLLIPCQSPLIAHYWLVHIFFHSARLSPHSNQDRSKRKINAEGTEKKGWKHLSEHEIRNSNLSLIATFPYMNHSYYFSEKRNLVQ